ncbi:MAG: hypothetical protein EBX50_17240 [Chitinophagia bacterium]|nr:hypothetical protein [Chitinophagia bacterium]
MKFDNLVNLILEQTKSLSPFDIDVLAALLVKEAGGERDYIAGMAGVMNTINARAKKNPSNYISVALKPKQFSAFNSIKSQQDLINIVNQTKKHPNFNAAKDMVISAASGTLPNLIGPATHYHVTSGPSTVRPSWTSPQYGGKNTQASPTTTIGSHTFFSGVR